jgi:hypothetical protein
LIFFLRRLRFDAVTIDYFRHFRLHFAAIFTPLRLLYCFAFAIIFASDIRLLIIFASSYQLIDAISSMPIIAISILSSFAARLPPLR